MTWPRRTTGDPPYPVQGAIYGEEAVMLLRKFYVQENEKGKLLEEALTITCNFTSNVYNFLQNSTRATAQGDS